MERLEGDQNERKEDREEDETTDRFKEKVTVEGATEINEESEKEQSERTRRRKRGVQSPLRDGDGGQESDVTRSGVVSAVNGHSAAG